MKNGESSQRILLQTLLTESCPEELELMKSEPKSFLYGRRPLMNTDFYILDVHTGDVKTLPRIVQDRDSELCRMAAALRSRVYMFGGQIRGDTDQPQSPGKTTSTLFYFLDLDQEEAAAAAAGGGWKRAGPPLTANEQLHLDAGVAFAGNMYFFRDSPFSCLCELFDPKSHQWRRIKSLPGADDDHQGRRLHIAPPVLADDKNDRIIVRINDSMYAYYPSRDEWEFVVKGFTGWYSQLHPVTIVDGVIYIHHRKIPGFFRAFDIATKQYLNVQLSNNYDESSLLHLHSYGNLVHLGDGILCLLGQTYQDHEPGQSQTTSLHIVQFKIELIKNNNDDTKEVLVTPTSSKYHHLTSRCHLVNCRVLI